MDGPLPFEDVAERITDLGPGSEPVINGALLAELVRLHSAETAASSEGGAWPADPNVGLVAVMSLAIDRVFFDPGRPHLACLRCPTWCRQGAKSLAMVRVRRRIRAGYDDGPPRLAWENWPKATCLRFLALTLGRTLRARLETLPEAAALRDSLRDLETWIVANPWSLGRPYRSFFIDVWKHVSARVVSVGC
jgi:hypothetical protein